MQLIRIPITITPEEEKALNDIQEILPLQEDYKGLLSLVSNMDVQLGAVATGVVQKWLEGLYFNGLVDSSNGRRSTIMDELNKSVDTFASEVQGVLSISDVSGYAQTVRQRFFELTTNTVYETIKELKAEMEDEVSSSNYDLNYNETLEICELVRHVESLAKKAGVEVDFQEDYGEIARYGILRTMVALCWGDPEEFRSEDLFRKSTYQSIELARSAIREIDNEETYSRLEENVSSLEAYLESMLGIDVDRVKEFTGEEKPKVTNKFIEQYKREIAQLEVQNEAALDDIYAQEGSKMFTKRYNVIVGLFKEALLNEAIGNIERAEKLVDDANHEFQDFAEVMENPELLLAHYKLFRQFVGGLGLRLKDDFTEEIEAKAKGYQEANSSQNKKGLLGRLGGWFAGSDNNNGPAFITGETLDDVMVKYQNRFAQDKVKTQIIVSNREIVNQRSKEAIVKAFINGLLLAQTDRRVLERFGMKPGETYSQEAAFTDKGFEEAVNNIYARIRELNSAIRHGKKDPASTYVRRKGEDEEVSVQDELRDLRYAKHRLRADALSADESEIYKLKSKPGYREGLGRIVQLRGTLTEGDIGGEEDLMRDTFTQHVTRSLAEKGIVPALDQQIRSEGSTTYDVERAWENVTAAIPPFKILDEQGNIAQLVEAVETTILQGEDPVLVIKGAIDEHLGEYTERSTPKKLVDAVTQGANALKELRMKYLDSG